jgi:hypothetical protein
MSQYIKSIWSKFKIRRHSVSFLSTVSVVVVGAFSFSSVVVGVVVFLRVVMKKRRLAAEEGTFISKEDLVAEEFGRRNGELLWPVPVERCATMGPSRRLVSSSP